MAEKKNTIDRLGFEFLIILLGLTILSFFATEFWWADLSTHPRWQYSLLSLLLLIPFAWRRKWICLALSLVLFLWHSSFLWPMFFGEIELVGENKPKTTVFLYNVYSPNDRYDEVMQYIRQENTDFVVLLEVTPKWQKEILSLKDLYPYSEIHPSDDNFGIALLTKKKGVFRTTMLDSSGVLSIFFEDEDMRFLATHPVPPMSKKYFFWRNEHYKNLAELISQQKDKPTVVAGDLNTSPYSPFYSELLESSQLKNSLVGQGNLMTWPTQLPALGSPLDHVLHSEHFQTLKYRRGKDLGSDHWPVLVELADLVEPKLESHLDQFLPPAEE